MSKHNSKMFRLGVWLEKRDLEHLRKIADSDERPIAYMFRKAVKEFIRKKESSKQGKK